MATVVNDRETGLASSSVRIISPDVYITATGNTFGNIGGTITPNTITLTANTVTSRAASMKNWYCANSDAPASWVLLASGTGNTYSISKEAFLAAIGTNSTSVVYKCVVTEPLYSDAVATYSIEYNDGVSISTLRYLDIVSPVVFKSSAGALESGTHTSIVATAKKIVGNGLATTDNTAYITITANGATRVLTATATGTTTFTPGDTDGKMSYLVELWSAADTTIPTNLLDSDDVPVVFAGSNGITAVLSNDSHSIPVDQFLTNGVYTNSGSNIYVYEGATQLTYDTAAANAGTAGYWKATVGTTTNITAGSITDGGSFGVLGEASNFSSVVGNSTATIPINITGKTRAGVSFSITKTQTLSRLAEGVSAYRLDLSNEAHVIPSLNDGSGGNYTGATTNASVYRGSTLDTGWTFSVSAATAGITYNITTAGTLTVSATTDAFTSGTITVKASKGTLSDLYADFSVSKSKSGAAYSIVPSVSAVKKNVLGAFTPTSITFSAYKLLAAGNPVAYSGYITIYTSTDGINFTLAIAETYGTSSSYTISGATVTHVRATLALVTTGTLVDQETVPIVSDGNTGKGYVVEINDGIRNVTFDANSNNPSPAQSAFSVVLKEDGTAVTPTAYSWTAGGHLSGTSSVSTFTPTCAGTFVASNNDFVKVTVTYNTKQYVQTIPIAVTKIGTGGAVGAEGSKSTTVTAFAWGGGTAPTHTGTSDYVWATGAYSAPSGWATSAGTGSNGQTLYQLSYTIVALASAATSTVQWGTAATVNTIGFRQDGSVGVQGAGARKAYIVMLNANDPGTPASYSGDGIAATAVTGSYASSGWSTTLPTVPTSIAGTRYVLWLSDGNYYPSGSPSNANTTVWGASYLATFKVDSLQAVSALLGNVQISDTGSLFTTGKGYESGNGIFIGYNSSLYRLDIGSPSQYLRWTGSALNFTGNLETTGMVKATGSVTTAETNSFSCITGKSTGTYAALGDKYVAGVYGFSESYTGVLGYGSGDGMGVYALADGGNWAVKALGPIYTNCNIRISGDPTADTGIELMGGAIALGYSGDHGTAGQCLLSNGTGNLPYWGSPAYATAAGSATTATNASYATSAGTAGSATTAGTAGSATTAGTATNVTGAGTVYTTYVESGRATGDTAMLATGGGTTHGLRAVNTDDGTSGLVGVANGYDFYADGAGNYGPFTGSHEGVLLKTSPAVLGDILLDNGIASRKNISNAISELSLSNTSNSKKVVGVLSSIPKSLNTAIIPSAFKHVDGSIQESYNAYRALYNIVSINSVGEGQMNVCGENGNLEIGDLISTSSIPGKGMKQYDDVVRNITVAKCRENVTFSSATEVKMVACIYMCG